MIVAVMSIVWTQGRSLLLLLLLLLPLLLLPRPLLRDRMRVPKIPPWEKAAVAAIRGDEETAQLLLRFCLYVYSVLTALAGSFAGSFAGSPSAGLPACSLTDSFYSLTHSLTHSLMHSLALWRVYNFQLSTSAFPRATPLRQNFINHLFLGPATS